MMVPDSNRALARVWNDVLRTLLMACGALAALSALPAPAAAQSERDSATARALFEQGVELADQSDWMGAADRFARSNELRRSPVVGFNLASAWVELGKLVEASEMLRQVEKDPTAKPKLKKDARALLARLEPRIGTLVVTVEPERETDEVRLNDRALPLAALGVPTPVDPGIGEISVIGSGTVLWTKRVEVLPGGAQRITIELPQTAPPPPPEPPATAPTPRETAAAAPLESDPGPAQPRDEGESDSVWEEPWLWVGIGAVVVAGTVLAIALAAGGDDSREEPTVGSLEPGHVKVEL